LIIENITHMRITIYTYELTFISIKPYDKQWTCGQQLLYVHP